MVVFVARSAALRGARTADLMVTSLILLKTFFTTMLIVLCVNHKRVFVISQFFRVDAFVLLQCVFYRDWSCDDVVVVR